MIPAMKTVLVKEKLSEQAYRILREMITNSRFLPGTRLNVEQLARNMEISRTPLWEAVNRLLQEGLLVSLPNRGVFVPDLTPLEALEIYSVREVLEGLAAKLAAKNVCEDAIVRMEDSLTSQYDMAIRQDLIGYSRHDHAFHDLIHELSQNKFLQEMLDFIRGRTRPTSMNFKPLLMTSYHDHRAILEALKKRDGILAQKTIKAHIRRVIGLLKKSAARPHNQLEKSE